MFVVGVPTVGAYAVRSLWPILPHSPARFPCDRETARQLDAQQRWMIGSLSLHACCASLSASPCGAVARRLSCIGRQHHLGLGRGVSGAFWAGSSPVQSGVSFYPSSVRAAPPPSSLGPSLLAQSELESDGWPCDGGWAAPEVTALSRPRAAPTPEFLPPLPPPHTPPQPPETGCLCARGDETCSSLACGNLAEPLLNPPPALAGAGVGVTQVIRGIWATPEARSAPLPLSRRSFSPPTPPCRLPPFWSPHPSDTHFPPVCCPTRRSSSPSAASGGTA